MTRPWISLLVVAGLAGAGALGAAGCKAGSCEDICEQRKSCEGAEVVPDCAAACASELEVAEKAGCAEEYDSMLSCQGTVTSCTSKTFCAAQEGAYAACISEACKDDPSKCKGE
jgi:hypothetical protein